MDYFLYTIVILVGFSICGKIAWIAEGDFPARTQKTEAWDVFLNSILVVWAIILLIT